MSLRRNKARTDLPWAALGHRRLAGRQVEHQTQQGVQPTQTPPALETAEEQQTMDQEIDFFDNENVVEMEITQPETNESQEEPQTAAEDPVETLPDAAPTVSLPPPVPREQPKESDSEDEEGEGTESDAESRPASPEPILGEGDKDEDMVDNNPEDQDATEQDRIKTIKSEWKAAGKSLCQKTLPNGEMCNGRHPQRLHDDDRALKAHETRAAIQRLEGNRLLPTEQELEARRTAKKAEKKAKQKAKKASKKVSQQDGAEDQPKVQQAPPSSKRKAQEQPDADGFTTVERKKKQKTTGSTQEARKTNPVCPNCQKRHGGKCRVCPNCKGFHTGPCRKAGQKQPAQTSVTSLSYAQVAATQPATQAPAHTGTTPALMSRNELMERLADNIRTEVGLSTFVNLMNRDGSGDAANQRNQGGR